MTENTTPHILLVDDEPRFLDSLQAILNHYEYRCTKALTGTEAINSLRNNSYDLALLDVELPDMSGCDIAGFIKTSCTATTSIMLTGMNTVDTAVQAMKMGAYDFLNKPLNHEMLLKTLRKALQHNQLQQELAVSEQRFQILSEAAWEGIAIHEQGKIIEANSQFLIMFGYTRKDIAAGLHLSDLLAPTASESTEAYLKDIGSPFFTTGLKGDGAVLPIETKSLSIMHRNRQRQVWVVRDLSERQRAEEEKLTLQKKLAVASRLNALGLMAGSVAHDLNNILTGVVSYPDLLLSQMDESDIFYSQIQKIQAAGKRAAAVVADLVAITRGRVQQKSVANINDLVFAYLNSLEHSQRLVHFADTVIQTELQRDIDNFCCSPQHIHNILLNLIGNALDAAPTKGRIRIITENCTFNHPLENSQKQPLGEDFIKLVVEDNGPGINPEDRDQIFDPFYSTKVLGKSGTGLGLAVVWNIVQDHNGWIDVQNSEPGARFELYFPATDESLPTVDHSIATDTQPAEGIKILIIDDQREQSEFLENVLINMGHTPFSVTSGEDAISYLEKKSVELIITDMIMGKGLNGRQTLERILATNPLQKAIVVSGYVPKDEVEKTKKLGITQYLEKPITISSIKTAIRETLLDN